MRNVLRHDDGVVNHHPHRQNQAREGNDIERHLAEIEQEERNHHRHRHAKSNHNRRAYIPQEEDGDNEYQQEADSKVTLQVRYGIVQEFRLVAAYLKVDVGIKRREIVGRFLQLRLHVVHVLIALLDDGQGHGTLSACHRQSLLLLRHHRHPAEVLQLHQPFPLADMDILHILRCTEQCGDADVVFIITVSHQHASRLHIVGSQGVFNVFYRDARDGQFLCIGYNLEHPSRHSGNVCHRHFGQLLDAPFHHVFRQFAQGEELLFVRVRERSVVLQGHVQIQHGNVRRTRLDGLGAFGFLRQAVHGGIYLLVHFDEGQVGVHPEVELHADDACTVACLALDFTKSGHLQ